VASSFFSPQAARATAAISDAIKSDFFILVSSKRSVKQLPVKDWCQTERWGARYAESCLAALVPAFNYTNRPGFGSQSQDTWRKAGARSLQNNINLAAQGARPGVTSMQPARLVVSIGQLE
jgi:hypothetical protein